MAEKSLFFNAFPDSNFETGYDRNYSADDISDWFSIVCATGVVKNGLAVSAGTGLSVNVAVGKATIKGKGYVNNAVLNLATYADGTAIVAPTGSSPRYDLIVLRMDNTQTKSARKTSVVVLKGNSSIPTEASLTRTESIWDLLLAYAVIQPNASSIDQIVDCRGNQDLCPWFVAVKGYDDYYDAIVQQFESNVTMQSAGNLAITDLPSKLYLGEYSLVEVYCNGLKEENTDYSVSVSGGFIAITFTSQKSAGAEICVVLDNFIQGEGLATAIAQYNQWVQDVADIKQAQNHIYVCNGQTDNVEISNLINSFVNGGTDYGSMHLKIVGNFGYTAFVTGAGTSANPYRLFNFSSGNRKVYLDFTDCSEISVTANGVYAWIFYGEANIKGLNLIANGSGAGSNIRVFYSDVVCEDCRFWVNAYLDSWIAKKGTFTNCRGSVSNATGNSYCFINSDVLRVIGGEYYAYTGSSSARSAVVAQSVADSVAIVEGVSAPTSARSGYYQTNSVYQPSSGNYVRCSNLISALPIYCQGDNVVTGTIPISK